MTKLFRSHFILVQKVFRLPGAAFKSSSDVGAFVSCVVQDLYELLPYNPDLKPLFVVPSKRPDAAHDDLFVDQSVYGRNRNFRLHIQHHNQSTIHSLLLCSISYVVAVNLSNRPV